MELNHFISSQPREKISHTFHISSGDAANADVIVGQPVHTTSASCAECQTTPGLKRVDSFAKKAVGVSIPERGTGGQLAEEGMHSREEVTEGIMVPSAYVKPPINVADGYGAVRGQGPSPDDGHFGDGVDGVVREADSGVDPGADIPEGTLGGRLSSHGKGVRGRQTADQERELRRRAAALSIRVSPYLKASSGQVKRAAHEGTGSKE